MGRKFVKRAVLWVLVLAIWPTGYVAQAQALASEDKTTIAGALLADAMALILDTYVGDSITAEELYEAAIRGMMEPLDTYSVYLDEEELSDLTGSMSGNLTGIGVVLRMDSDEQAVILRVLPDSPALEAGLRKGDMIVEVNDTTVEGLTVSEIVAMITDPSITRVKLKLNRGAIPMTFYMNKRKITSTTVYTEKLEDILGPSITDAAKDYRYVNISAVNKTTSSELRKVLTALKSENVKGIILDMRGNPGGYLDVAIDICGQIVPRGAIVHTLNNKGEKSTLYSYLQKAPFEKMVVLVDEDTASAAELITAALQDAKVAIVVGETTYGKGVIQTMYSLPPGGALKITTEEYLRRSGEVINHIGVIPDVAIDMDINDYETASDTGIRKAWELLQAEESFSSQGTLKATAH